MIDLYYWPTPNGHKITIALEEMGLPHNVKPVNIGKGDQFDPAFLAFSPNNRMPAIIDHDVESPPQTVFESGAILFYLAEKTGMFLPREGRDRVATMEWLMWQMGGFGPMLGQAHHFNYYAPDRIDYAMDRYSNEANRVSSSSTTLPITPGWRVRTTALPIWLSSVDTHLSTPECRYRRLSQCQNAGARKSLPPCCRESHESRRRMA